MKKRFIFLFALCLFIASCSNDDDDIGTVNLRVDSFTVACEGVAIGECLLVQEGNMIGTEEWNYFYFKDGIEGFVFEAGYVYDLIIQKTAIKNPPQDGSSIRYQLIKIISKTQVL